jgi:hypothetical protein
MKETLAADVARVLAVLLGAKAWFRHGLSDHQLCQLTGLSNERVVVARRDAEMQGLVERQGAYADEAVTMLTPKGVALAQGLYPYVDSDGAVH